MQDGIWTLNRHSSEAKVKPAPCSPAKAPSLQCEAGAGVGYSQGSSLKATSTR